MRELEVKTTEHHLNKPLSEFNIQELEVQLSTYEAQLYNTQVLLTGEAKTCLTKMLGQLGKTINNIGIQYATPVFWLSEKVACRVMTIYSETNLAQELARHQVEFECFGNFMNDGKERFCYTVRSKSNASLNNLKKVVDAIDGTEVIFKENGMPSLNILDIRIMQTLAESMTLSHTNLEIASEWVSLFGSVNVSVYQLDLGIKGAKELLHEKRTDELAEQVLKQQGTNLDGVVDMTVEKTSTVAELKAKSSTIRVELEGKGVDVSGVKRGKKKAEIIAEINELRVLA